MDIHNHILMINNINNPPKPKSKEQKLKQTFIVPTERIRLPKTIISKKVKKSNKSNKSKPF